MKQYIQGILFTVLFAAIANAQSIEVTETNVDIDTHLNVTGTVTAADLTVAGDTTTATATVGTLVVGTSTILSEGFFESAGQLPPGGGNTLTVPHGLGGVPRFVTVSARCISATGGWAVNDEILLSSVHMRTSNYGMTTGVSATHFKLTQQGPLNVHRFDNNSLTEVTSANWRLVFRAWR